jgi:hypothetical protein
MRTARWGSGWTLESQASQVSRPGPIQMFASNKIYRVRDDVEQPTTIRDN